MSHTGHQTVLKGMHLHKPEFSLVQFNSFKMVSVRLEKPIHAPPCLSEVPWCNGLRKTVWCDTTVVANTSFAVAAPTTPTRVPTIPHPCLRPWQSLQWQNICGEKIGWWYEYIFLTVFVTKFETLRWSVNCGQQRFLIIRWMLQRDVMNWVTFNYTCVDICICDTQHS